MEKPFLHGCEGGGLGTKLGASTFLNASYCVDHCSRTRKCVEVSRRGIHSPQCELVHRPLNKEICGGYSVRMCHCTAVMYISTNKRQTQTRSTRTELLRVRSVTWLPTVFWVWLLLSAVSLSPPAIMVWVTSQVCPSTTLLEF